MKTRIQIAVVVMGLLAMAAVASAANGGGACGNIPPRDGTGRQIGRSIAAPSVVQWLKIGLRYGLPIQLGALGWGPGDGTGFGGDGPKDGTGYGPGSAGDGTGECDGSGPRDIQRGPAR